MRRFIINKGISKEIIAISRFFEVGEAYTAAIYNPKDLTVKIAVAAYCTLYEDRHQIVFDFSGEETDKLKTGYATIEIYDQDKNMMVYKDNFAVIRKNSLPISGDEPTPVVVWTYLMDADITHSSTTEPNTATRYANSSLTNLGDNFSVVYEGMRVRLVPIGSLLDTPWEGSIVIKAAGPNRIYLVDDNGDDADFDTLMNTYGTYNFKLEYVS